MCPGKFTASFYECNLHVEINFKTYLDSCKQGELFKMQLRYAYIGFGNSAFTINHFCVARAKSYKNLQSMIS